MTKSSKKNHYYIPTIIQHLKNKYGFSIDYIQKSIRGDREGTIPSKMKKEYYSLEKSANQAIQQKANDL